MKLILLTDVKGTGKKGDVVEVSDGFGRNFLIPRKLAKAADAGALSDLKNKEAARLHKIEVEKAEARELAEKLESIQLMLHMTAGADGKFYGSITSQNIADEMEKTHGISLDKRKISIDEPIKTFGKYEIEVKLYGAEIMGKINLVVTEK